MRYASLFCGCGGFDLGFNQAGFSCVGAFDNNPDVVSVYHKNIGNEARICDLSSNNPSGLAGSANIDVLLAGPPCQGFSTIGKRKLNDPRNHLLIRAGEIALEIMPKCVIIENVTGVTKGKHKRYWDGLQGLLRGAGYSITVLKCEGEKLGLAQKRTRMIMVAWRERPCWKPTLPSMPAVPLKEVLSGLDSSVPNHNLQFLNPNDDLFKIASHIQPGQKLCNVRGGGRAVHTWDIPEVYGHTTKSERVVLESIRKLRRRLRLRKTGDADPVLIRDITREIGEPAGVHVRSLLKKGYLRSIERRYDLAYTFNGNFRRLSWNAPSNTVDTRFTDPRFFLHPDENRGLSLREAARIQSFPDDFIFEGSESAKKTMIGNAVPPQLANMLAVMTRDQFLR